MNYDYVIIGAGLAGITAANILANKDKKILLIEKNDYIGGNCSDYYQDGILIHRHGPHIFHTNNQKVWDYLSQFTEWTDYKHKVVAWVDGDPIPLPVNLNTIQQLLAETDAKTYLADLLDEFPSREFVTLKELFTCPSDVIKHLACIINKKIYYNYTRKMWGKYYGEISDAVINRMPIRLTYNDNYFSDQFQGLPKDGYTKMFGRMIHHPNIELSNDATWVKNIKYLFELCIGSVPFIYTGRIDKLFSYKYGHLPYRSIRFSQETKDIFPVVNYPNAHIYTRETTWAGFTVQKNIVTTETPCEYKPDSGMTPYYPINTKKTSEQYAKYKALADKYPNLILLGRLAEYKYYNMDQVIERAMEVTI